jgi:hypothetical protein
MRKVPIPTPGWQFQRMIAHLDNEILRLILMQSYPTHCSVFPSNFVVSPLISALLAHQNGRMFSSCFCAPFNRWRKPLMYSSSGSCCCWCISSNARKTSMRCFFNITRSVCSNSRTTVRYRAVLIGLQVFISKCGLKVVLGVGEQPFGLP